MAAAPDVTRCAVHPEALAVATCRRCGRFACDGCLELVEEDPFCAECHARPEVNGRTPWRAVVTLLAAVGGVFLGPLLSVPAIAYSSWQLRAIEQDRGSVAARRAYRAARVIGWITLAAFTVWFGALAWLVAARLNG